MSTTGNQPESPIRVTLTAGLVDLWVLVDSEPCYRCPYAGCTARVSAAMGADWCVDVLERHVELHHKRWR